MSGISGMILHTCIYIYIHLIFDISNIALYQEWSLKFQTLLPAELKLYILCMSNPWILKFVLVPFR